jgi:hypothetical protein
MKKWLLILSLCLASCLASTSLAADFEPFAGPKPLVVWIQSDPWAMVIGADTPRVAIYEDGRAVFLRKTGKFWSYRTVLLAPKTLAGVKMHLRPVLALKTLKSHYNISPGITDQPEAMLYLREGTHEAATNVYGLMTTGTRLPAYTVMPSSSKATMPPAEVLKLHQWLSTLNFAGSQEWKPRYTEMILWDYSYAPQASIHWPKAWPSLTSNRAVKRKSSSSIFLDTSLMPQVEKLMKGRKEKGALEMDGKKWAVSFRPIFASEPLWRRAFAH